MDTDSSGAKATAHEEAVPCKGSRLPPIILTSETNLIQLQKQLKSVVKENFEFRSTQNRTRVITRDVVDFRVVKSHFSNSNLSYYSFYLKSQKPIKAVICRLPPSTPAEDISDRLVNLVFDVISLKQMTGTRQSPSGETTTRNLLVFLVTLPRVAKSQEMFNLPSLCYNCQQSGHVWANCKQPPHCLWCGGSHLHKECPEKGNAASTPACCNYQLAEGESPSCQLSGLQTREGGDPEKEVTEDTQDYNGKGVLFQPHNSRCVLHGGPLRQDRGRAVASDTPGGGGNPCHNETKGLCTPTPAQSAANRSVSQAPNVNSQPLENMLRVVTVVQQIMTEFSDAISEEDKIVAITKIVLNLIKQNGH
jgi:hypothetical protein